MIGRLAATTGTLPGALPELYQRTETLGCACGRLGLYSFWVRMNSPSRVVVDLLGERHVGACIASASACSAASAAAAVVMNMRNAQLLWGLVHFTELAAAHAINREMAVRHKTLYGSPDWLTGDSRELGSLLAQVQRVRQAAEARGLPTTQASLAAHMHFGFWCRLIGREFQASLWPDLQRAFPHAPDRNRQTVAAPMNVVRTLRNHVAHHTVVPASERPRLVHAAVEVLSFIEPLAVGPLLRTLRLPRGWLGRRWLAEVDDRTAEFGEQH